MGENDAVGAPCETRPIQPAETPHVAALGDLLRALRNGAGLSQRGLAERASVSRSLIERIEGGSTRTRSSTLLRLARVVAAKAPKLGTAEDLHRQLVNAAGPALAPESPRMRQIERRRDRKQRRVVRWEAVNGDVETYVALRAEELLRAELARRAETKRREKARRRRKLESRRERAESMDWALADKGPQPKGARLREASLAAWRA